MQHGPAAGEPWSAAGVQVEPGQSAPAPHAFEWSFAHTRVEFGPAVPFPREHESAFLSTNAAFAVAVVGRRMNWKREICVSTPSLNVPSLSGQLASAADHVSESTGSATAAWTPAGSGVPFPTVVSM